MNATSVGVSASAPIRPYHPHCVSEGYGGDGCSGLVGHFDTEVQVQFPSSAFVCREIARCVVGNCHRERNIVEFDTFVVICDDSVVGMEKIAWHPNTLACDNLRSIYSIINPAANMN